MKVAAVREVLCVGLDRSHKGTSSYFSRGYGILNHPAWYIRLCRARLFPQQRSRKIFLQNRNISLEFSSILRICGTSSLQVKLPARSTDDQGAIALGIQVAMLVIELRIDMTKQLNGLPVLTEQYTLGWNEQTVGVRDHGVGEGEAFRDCAKDGRTSLTLKDWAVWCCHLRQILLCKLLVHLATLDARPFALRTLDTQLASFEPITGKLIAQNFC